MDVLNPLGISFDTDMRQVITDLPSEITFGGQDVKVSASDVSIEITTMEGGYKVVPGVEFVAIRTDFIPTAPTAGNTLTFNGSMLRIIAAETCVDDSTLTIRCSYRDD